MDLREEACWLLLVFESGLPIRVVNTILVTWCKQLGRTLQDFFDADAQEWNATCQLGAEAIEKLEQAKAKRVTQAFLIEQLLHQQISMVTVLDPAYPSLLKQALGRNQIPPLLFYMGDLTLLEQQTIAIIGSRKASETSLAFTRAFAHGLAEQETNVISGFAKGVDRAAYEGAISSLHGSTTAVLPHGIRKLSKVQMKGMQARIESGNLLLLSQFHPDAPWLVSRAMDRNKVVTGLAQIVIVAESDMQGGTWDGANGALKQGRRVYVRAASSGENLPAHTVLLEKGAYPLPWPVKDLSAIVEPLLHESSIVREKQRRSGPLPNQLSLLAVSYES
jgi:DNA protecting protein DprA